MFQEQMYIFLDLDHLSNFSWQRKTKIFLRWRGSYIDWRRVKRVKEFLLLLLESKWMSKVNWFWAKFQNLKKKLSQFMRKLNLGLPKHGKSKILVNTEINLENMNRFLQAKKIWIWVQLSKKSNKKWIESTIVLPNPKKNQKIFLEWNEISKASSEKRTK